MNGNRYCHLLDIAYKLDDANLFYGWLIEHDTVFTDKFTATYHALINQNNAHLDAILAKMSNPVFIRRSKQAHDYTPAVTVELTDKQAYEILMHVEVALCKGGEILTELIDKNPNVTDEMRAFYNPIRRQHKQAIKASRFQVQAMMDACHYEHEQPTPTVDHDTAEQMVDDNTMERVVDSVIALTAPSGEGSSSVASE